MALAEAYPGPEMSARDGWTASSHSNGTNCVEWRVSSHSMSNGQCLQWRVSTHCQTGECVQVAASVLVRDSKLAGSSPVLSFSPSVWSGFTRLVGKDAARLTLIQAPGQARASTTVPS